MYSTAIFNSQQLLFGKTQPVNTAGSYKVPDEYYDQGWTVLNDIDNALEAIELQESFLKNINQKRLKDRIDISQRTQLVKADQIPVCNDVVATSFQILHFDMGLPFIESDDQLLITHVGIYLPKTTAHHVSAKTRLLELDGILKNISLSATQIEQKVTDYVKKYGDGWKGYNTLRLACFARFLDALSDKKTLSGEIDKTVGQWFQASEKLDSKSAHQQEVNFYQQFGINLHEREKQVLLQPGQLLILDNMRVVHGRIGVRQEKELYNFMFGFKDTSKGDIRKLRKNICSLVK